MQNILNIKNSEYLNQVIENDNHDDLALLWIDITKEKIKCVDSKKYTLYKFDTDTLLYEKLQINEFSEIVRTELKQYLKDVSTANTDVRLLKLINKICNKTYSSDVAKIIAVKKPIYCKKFLKKLDNKPHVVNVNNGIIDLKTGEFKTRTNKDLYSLCLDFDYTEKLNKKVMAEIREDFKNICNDDETFLEFMFSWLGYCLTGETNETKSLWCIGHKAGNGKSTISKIFVTMFKNYCYKFKSESLNEKYSKLHKELAQCKGVRYAYIEELKQEKLDTTVYKDLVDGDHINNEVLFSTTAELNITFKLTVISNTDPNFKADKGMMRRGILVNHTNEFYEKDDFEACNGKKGIYLKNKWIIEKYKKDKYKNALLHILLPYAKRYYADGLIVPKIYRNSFKDLCEENDKMQEFINSCVTITNNDDDRIYKEEFRSVYNAHSKLNFNWITILSDVRRTGLDYNKEKRCNYNGLSQKGCIVGIKFRDFTDDFIHINNNPLDANVDKEVNLENEIERLNKIIEELKLQIK